MTSSRIVILLFLSTGCRGLDVSLTLDDPTAGFFLRPFRSAQSDVTVQEEHLVGTGDTAGPLQVTAQWGPFHAHGNITPAEDAPPPLNASRARVPRTQLVAGLHVSAHIVTGSVSAASPRLQTLFHAMPRDPFNGARGAANTNKKERAARLCVRMRVLRPGAEEAAVCVLSRDSPVCVAAVTLPRSWWGRQVPAAQVWYSVAQVERALQCSSAANSILPGKTRPQQAAPRAWAGQVTLAQAQPEWREVKEDQHVLVYVPQRSFHPGSKFRVPVRLQAESDLQLFVVRVRARNGIHIVGAEPADSAIWRTTVDLNPKRRSAMVTAFVADSKKYVKSKSVQSIFEWIFEVEDTTDTDPGRITFILEYELNTQLQEKYGSVENRVVARIHIQHDHTQDIVPVIKSADIVNTAMLTGQMQAWPLRIYSLSPAGKISDVTSQTTCHTGDEHVLKVANSCNQVYLDGTETRGSPSVNVIAKYGRHTRFLFFRVWVPELPLQLTLSDDRLSLIKRWRAPKHQRRTSRGTAAADQLRQDTSSAEEYTTTCNLRYQQAQVQVYARFLVPDGSHNDHYLAHRKALMKVTDLVLDRLRVADTSVATISRNVVDGLKPGRTEIQVLSRLGRVIGAHELRVSKSKVSIKRLRVDVVSGLSVGMTSQGELPGTMVARVARHEMLSRKYQEGVLDVAVKFSDNTYMELEHVPPSDYFLNTDTLNNHVVAFGPMMSPDRPRVIALGEGNGELLKLSLELGDACSRKSSKPLAVSYVYVNVDFKDDEDTALNKDKNSVATYAAKDKIAEKKKHLKKFESKTAHKPNFNKMESVPLSMDISEFPQGDQPDLYDSDALQEVAGNSAALNSKNKQVVQRNHALEMGLYVLVAIFCVAIVVFAANCLVYVNRYRRKHGGDRWGDAGTAGPAEPVSQQAAEWVWIGRSTLERNAVNTACAQALLPDEDFNGNRASVTSEADAERESRSNRSSTCSAGGPLEEAAAAGPQRQSVISTYKGSECSIRITSNPLAGDEPPPVPPRGPRSPHSPRGAAHTPAQSPLAKLPPAVEEESADESPISSDDEGHHDDERAALNASHASLTSINNGYHSDRGTGYHSDPGQVSDGTVRFDSEALGMTYDELMQYFDNLKESTA